MTFPINAFISTLNEQAFHPSHAKNPSSWRVSPEFFKSYDHSFSYGDLSFSFAVHNGCWLTPVSHFGTLSEEVFTGFLAALQTIDYCGFLLNEKGTFSSTLRHHATNAKAEVIAEWLEPYSRHLVPKEDHLHLALPHHLKTLFLHIDWEAMTLSVWHESTELFHFSCKQDSDAFIKEQLDLAQSFSDLTDDLAAVARTFDKAAFRTVKSHVVYVYCQELSLNFQFDLSESPSVVRVWWSLGYVKKEKVEAESIDVFKKTCLSQLTEMLRIHRLRALTDGRINNFFCRLCYQHYRYIENFHPYYRGTTPLAEVKKYLQENAENFQYKKWVYEDPLSLEKMFFYQKVYALGNSLPDILHNAPFLQEVNEAFSFGKYVFIAGDFNTEQPLLYVVEKDNYDAIMKDVPVFSEKEEPTASF